MGFKLPDHKDRAAVAAKARAAALEKFKTAAEPTPEELAAVGFYLSGHPLDDMVEALRRKRTDLLTDAIARVPSLSAIRPEMR